MFNDMRKDRLDRIISESIRRVINEGQSDGNPIEKWCYWCTNYHPDFIEKAWADNPNMADHLKGKFSMYLNRYGSEGAMPIFYLNLDGENRRILENYVLSNY
jgi:hypothetical protein